MYFCILLLGKERNAAPEKGLAHNVVMSLLTDLKNKGYHVYVDNYYTSPALFVDLMDNGFEGCGTVRNDRRGLSEKFKSIKLLKGNYKNQNQPLFHFITPKERHIVKPFVTIK